MKNENIIENGEEFQAIRSKVTIEFLFNKIILLIHVYSNRSEESNSFSNGNWTNERKRERGGGGGKKIEGRD